MPTVDIIDETFIVASRQQLRALLCDDARWMHCFPDVTFTVYEDRRLDGIRWNVSGALVGTAEVWLQEWADGTIVHAYLRAEPRAEPRAQPRNLRFVRLDHARTLRAQSDESRRRRRRVASKLRRRYTLPLKRHLTAVKDAVEGSRAAGTPRVPLAERVVSPRQNPQTRRQPVGAMTDQTTSSILIAADRAAVMAVIADFESYPAWATGVKSAEVVSQGPDGRAREVAFVLDAAPIKDEYTLRYDWDDDTQVSWSLVEAKMLKALEGAYFLAPKGDSTDVTYQLSVDLSIPMIGMLKRKGEKVIIDTALKGLKARVEARA